MFKEMFKENLNDYESHMNDYENDMHDHMDILRDYLHNNMLRIKTVMYKNHVGRWN